MEVTVVVAAAVVVVVAGMEAWSIEGCSDLVAAWMCSSDVGTMDQEDCCDESFAEI